MAPPSRAWQDGERPSPASRSPATLIRPFLVLLIAASQPSADPAGRYRLTGSPDTAAELVLHGDGRFEYGLSEGALDEASSGRWTRDKGLVRLNTDPKPLPPAFSAGPAERVADAPFAIRPTWPNGHGIAGVDFRIRFADGSSIQGYTQEDGWSADPAESRVPASIQLAIPMHGLVSPVFPLDGGRGRRFVFVLTSNDLGRIDFDAEPLELDQDRLVMRRFGRELRFLRVSED